MILSSYLVSFTVHHEGDPQNHWTEFSLPGEEAQIADSPKRAGELKRKELWLRYPECTIEIGLVELVGGLRSKGKAVRG